MADKKDKPQTTPPAPALIFPKEATIVDAEAVTFVWEPVDNAEAYRLEVSENNDFLGCIFEQEIEGRSSLTVANVFEQDNQLYFWRVLACADGLWSNPDHVESFTASDETTAREHIGVPDQDEELGPATALFRSSSVGAAAEVTGDQDLHDKEQATGVEHDGIESGQILGLALGVLTALAVAMILVIQWVTFRTQNVREASVGLSGYPELQNTETRARQLLSQYEVVDPDKGLYRIPIDRAMELMVTESYRSNPQGNAQEPAPAARN